MTAIETLTRVTQNFIVTHQNDRSFVGGHGYTLNITDAPIYNDYNLMLPGDRDVDAFTTASMLVYACMDKRQSADVYHNLSMNGQSRILTTSAGGAEQRNGKPGKLNWWLEMSQKRFDNDVSFWANVLLASVNNPELALLVHIKKCGGAAAQEGSEVVDSWIANGTEKNNMIARAVSMRDAIWRATRKKGNISVGCVTIDAQDKFAGISFYKNI